MAVKRYIMIFIIQVRYVAKYLQPITYYLQLLSIYNQSKHPCLQTGDTYKNPYSLHLLRFFT